MLLAQNYLNKKKNQWCVNPSLHMYSFTLQESDHMGRKGNCIKRSKIVPAVSLEFSGGKKMKTLSIELIAVMTFKAWFESPLVSELMSPLLCYSLYLFVSRSPLISGRSHFCLQHTHLIPSHWKVFLLQLLPSDIAADLNLRVQTC